LRREVKAAERLVSKYALKPPIDVWELAREFAEVEVDNIPTQCDGLVVGLDRPRPLVLIDGTQHETRQRFTLAHELGHILLPWHVGNFVCDTHEGDWSVRADEPEANRFAAELLVPGAWLRDLVAARSDDQVGPLTNSVLAAGVSTWVACFRLAETLPPGHVYAVTDPAGEVLISGQSNLTSSEVPKRGEKLRHERLDRFAGQVEKVQIGTRTITWWSFRTAEGTISAPAGDAGEVLRELAERHATPSLGVQRIRQSFGGIIGVANDRAKREGVTDAAGLYARFKSRFVQDRKLPSEMLEDPDFDNWLRMRASELED
jgi:uncharacterized protein DUF955